MSRFIRLLAAVPLVLALAVNAHAALDDQDSVVASLSISGAATLSLQPKNLVDNANASGIGFSLPAPGETLVLGAQYVQIAYSTNFDNWKIKTFTRNGMPADTVNYWGALVNPDNPAYKMYLRWLVKDDVGTPPLSWNDWPTYQDEADPGYDYNSNELQLAYGGAWGGGWAKLRDGSDCSSPLNLYLGGYTTGLVPGSYTAKIYFDLLHL